MPGRKFAVIKCVNQIVASKLFLHAIVAAIVLAGVVAGLETSPAIMAKHGAMMHGLDRLILGVFIVEALLKITAQSLRPWRYFSDGWNVFDFFIIVICVLPAGGPFAAVLRLARALRLLRLVSALPKLQLLLMLLPKIPSVPLLLLEQRKTVLAAKLLRTVKSILRLLVKTL